MKLAPTSRIAVAGAGSVGCYLGGRLAAAGRHVSLLLREKLARPISCFGLRLSDLEGREAIVTPGSLTLATEPAPVLANADVILVTVKCRDTPEIAELIARHGSKAAVVVSLQNGVRNTEFLRRVLGPHTRVTAGMVPFNIVQMVKEGEAPRFHRGSSGTIRIGGGIEGLKELLGVPGARVAEHSDIDALLWSKLLLNLNNALNALSDIPLAQELADRRWRLLLSDQMLEGLSALRAASIRLARIEGIHPQLIALALRLPDLLFGVAARRVLEVDPTARSSMWEDLAGHRPTEIDYIQGEVVELAGKHGLIVPLTQSVLRLIKAAEQARRGPPRLAPEEIRGRSGDAG